MLGASPPSDLLRAARSAALSPFIDKCPPARSISGRGFARAENAKHGMDEPPIRIARSRSDRTPRYTRDPHQRSIPAGL